MDYYEAWLEYPSQKHFDDEFDRLVAVEDVELVVLLYLFSSYIYTKDSFRLISFKLYTRICEYIADNWDDVLDNTKKMVVKKDVEALQCNLRISKHSREAYIKGQEFPFQLEESAGRYISSISVASHAESWDIIVDRVN